MRCNPEVVFYSVASMFLLIINTLMLELSDIRALLESDMTQQKYADNHNTISTFPRKSSL